MSTEAEAAELKRKRLDAWKKRLQEQQQRSSEAPASSAVSLLKPQSEPRNDGPAARIGLGFSLKGNKKNGKRNYGFPKLNEPAASIWGSDDEGDAQPKRNRGDLNDGLNTKPSIRNTASTERDSEDGQLKQKRNRWDSNPFDEAGQSRNPLVTMSTAQSSVLPTPSISEVDALDQFMDHLSAGAMGSVAIQDSSLLIDVGGSMMRMDAGGTRPKLPQQQHDRPNAIYGPSDWESETVCMHFNFEYIF